MSLKLIQALTNNLDLMQYQQKSHPFPEEEMLPIPFIRNFKVNCVVMADKKKKRHK